MKREKVGGQKGVWRHKMIPNRILKATFQLSKI